jgi:hypothetical protein
VTRSIWFVSWSPDMVIIPERDPDYVYTPPSRWQRVKNHFTRAPRRAEARWLTSREWLARKLYHLAEDVDPWSC